MDPVSEVFDDQYFINRIQTEMFGIILKADIEATQFSQSGLFKGTIRKKYIIDFLKDSIGEDNVERITDNPAYDVKIKSVPVKIRTITGKAGIKIKWTTDRDKVVEFLGDYEPSHGMLLARKRKTDDNREYPSGFFYIPVNVQQRVFNEIGIQNYLNAPRPDTNSRGIELKRNAIETLLADPETKHINVNWF